MKYTGLSISHYNRVIDYPLLAKNRPDFIIAKASEGANYKDAYFVSNYLGCKEYDIPFGGYHFWRSEPGLLQASNFISMANQAKMFCYWLDYEIKSKAPKTEITHMTDFIRKVYEHIGMVPFFYTNRNFAGNLKTAGIEVFITLPLVVAEYNWLLPRLVYPWISYRMYQASDNQKIPGLPSSAEIVYSDYSPVELHAIACDFSRMV